MKSSHTPSKWLTDKKDNKKLQFVREYIGKRSPFLLAEFHPLFNPTPLTDQQTNLSGTLFLLELYVGVSVGEPMNDAGQLRFNQIRAAWNGCKHRQKHQAELQSFYLDKKTKKTIKEMAEGLGKSQSAFLIELIEMASQNKASLFGLHEIMSKTQELSEENHKFKVSRDGLIEQINIILPEILEENCEYTVVKRELESEVKEVLKAHADEIRILQKNIVPTLKNAIRRYKEIRKEEA